MAIVTAVSIYSPGWGISRNDGKTLNGFLNQSEHSDGTNEPNFVTDLTLYFGNIDVRFHIHRFGGMDALFKLILRYLHKLIAAHYDTAWYKCNQYKNFYQ